MEADEPSFAVREDVFGAPSELSLDETPQDRYIDRSPPPRSPRRAGGVRRALDWSPGAGADPFQVEAPAAPPLPRHRASERAAPRGAPEPFAAPGGGALRRLSRRPRASPSDEPLSRLAACGGLQRRERRTLSDADVDRIARRVVELLGDKRSGTWPGR